MPFDSLRPEDIFQCKQCGECCKGFGGTYVNEADIAAIAAYLGDSPGRLAQTRCQPSGRRRVLAQGEDGYCVFYRDKLCGIHPVKPRMCRSWPFIRSVITDVSNWRIMAEICPGMRTDAPDEAIRDCVQQVIRERGGQ